MTVHRLILSLLFAVAVHNTTIQAQRAGSDTSAARPRDVVLSNAHAFVLRDAKRQIGYRIYVALPEGYGEGSKRYPVLYLLDADAAFSLATQAYRLLRVDSTTPDLLLIGIGYEVAGAARRTRRLQDLTPTRIAANSNTGESAAFLRFLTETIIPAIDSLYRTNPGDRAIYGHSLGGLFALYALFERPDVFRRYIVSSPSLWWDGAVVLGYESRFARNRASLPKSIFMSVGAEEPPDMKEWFQPFADSVRSRRYRDVRFTAVVLPEETHLSIVAPGFLRGLRSVYR